MQLSKSFPPLKFLLTKQKLFLTPNKRIKDIKSKVYYFKTLIIYNDLSFPLVKMVIVRHININLENPETYLNPFTNDQEDQTSDQDSFNGKHL